MRAGVVLAALALLGGCVGVEDSALFETDFEQAVAAARGDPAAVASGGPAPVVDAAASAPASGSLALSLELATMLAMEHNRDLAVRRLAPVVAGSFELLERGVFDPEAFAELRFLDERNQESSRSTSEQFVVEGTETDAVLGVRQRLPSGTTVEASVRQERRNSDRAPEQQTARVGFSVTQSLLRGRGPAVTLARVRQAKLDSDASLHELRGFAEALAADVRIAYWRCALAEREIEIFEESLAVARRQLDEVRQRIEVGVLPRAETPAAEVEVARREQALIEARSALAERRLLLLRLLGTDAYPPGAPLELTSRLESDARPVTDVEDRVRLAREARPDLAEARLRLASGRLETIVTSNGLLPRLDLFVALDRAGFGDTFGRSFSNLSHDQGDITVGVSLDYPLGNRSALARDLEARASRSQASRAVENLEQQVELEVRLAANELERARQQIAASARTRALQGRLLEAEQERFDVGVSTGLLVAQAQRDLLAAQIVEVESLVAHRIALVRLWLAEGSLLERSGIRIDR